MTVLIYGSRAFLSFPERLWQGVGYAQAGSSLSHAGLNADSFKFQVAEQVGARFFKHRMQSFPQVRKLKVYVPCVFASRLLEFTGQAVSNGNLEFTDSHAVTKRRFHLIRNWTKGVEDAYKPFHSSRYSFVKDCTQGCLPKTLLF